MSTYGENGESPSVLGRAMLKLINSIDENVEFKIWGLTSLLDLILLPSDDFRAPWKVKILAIDEDEIRIEYLLPEGSAPWNNAYAIIVVGSIQDAVELINSSISHAKIYARGKNQ